MKQYYKHLGKPEKLLLAMLAVVLAALLFSCNTIEKATQRVLTDETARNKVGAKWAELHPCSTDSTTTYIHGETILLTDSLTKVVVDTVKVNQLIDSLNKLQLTTDALVLASYEAGYKNALIEHPSTSRVDIREKKIMVDRDYKLILEDLIKANEKVAKLEGVVEQLKNQGGTDAKHKLFAYLSIGLLLIIIGILIKTILKW